MICALFYLPEDEENRFKRFATEEELEETPALQIAASPIAFQGAHTRFSEVAVPGE
jgi:hypothetical protein